MWGRAVQRRCPAYVGEACWVRCTLGWRCKHLLTTHALLWVSNYMIPRGRALCKSSRCLEDKVAMQCGKSRYRDVQNAELCCFSRTFRRTVVDWHFMKHTAVTHTGPRASAYWTVQLCYCMCVQGMPDIPDNMLTYTYSTAGRYISHCFFSLDPCFSHLQLNSFQREDAQVSVRLSFTAQMQVCECDVKQQWCILK